MKELLKEPFLHFVLIGAALFVLFAVVNDDYTPEDDTIIITEGKIENLATIFAKTWQRPPTQEELDGLIEDYLKEEVFYREALAMGLDSDDLIIRRRMRQKMEFVAEDFAASIEPTDQELSEFLTGNMEKFEIPPQYTFRQVYLDPDKHVRSLEADAEELKRRLQSGAIRNIEEAGDPIMLTHRFVQATPFEITRAFGDNFTIAISSLQKGQWQGPVRSGYGFHLVLLEDVTLSREPELAEVRPEVEREIMNERRLETLDAFYQGLRGKYEVIIEDPAPLDNAEEGQ